MKHSSRVAAVIAAMLTLSASAWSHSNAYLDSIQAPHGGQLRMSGPYHMELVVSTPGELTVYVTDHGDTPQMTAGAEGTAKVKNGKKEVAVKLEPAGENLLKGKGEFVVNAKTAIVVFLRMAGQDPEGATFTPLKPKTKARAKKAAAGHGEHH